MPFEIIRKPKGSSNKHKTLAHFNHYSPCKPIITYKAPTPFLDNLSVTLNVPSKEEGQDMWIAHWHAQHDTKTFKKCPKGKGYDRSYRISLPCLADSKHWPLYQVGFEQGCITHVRLELNPADLGAMGMQELHEVLTGLMDSGWAFIAKHGKVTRIDIAVDLPKVQMDQLLWLPQQGVTTKQWHQNGKLESYQLGKATGNRTMIYNRKAKRIAKGKPWAGKEGVRVERRLKCPNLMVHELDKLSWPFAGLHAVEKIATPPPGEKKDYIWNLVVLAAQTSGLPATLAILPQTKRTMYRKHFQQNSEPFWSPKAIWDNWIKTLSDLKIADPMHWN